MNEKQYKRLLGLRRKQIELVLIGLERWISALDICSMEIEMQIEELLEESEK